MYLRDLIKIGGISGPAATIGDDIGYTNSVISKIEKGPRNNLIIYLIREDNSLLGKVLIRQINNREDVLEKVLSSKKLIGKTLNDLRDCGVEDI